MILPLPSITYSLEAYLRLSCVSGNEGVGEVVPPTKALMATCFQELIIRRIHREPMNMLKAPCWRIDPSGGHSSATEI